MFLALTPAMPAASFIGDAGPTPDPANWFRTSLYSDDFDTTLTAALASEHADDYVLVIDSAFVGINNADKDLFVSGSAAATAELRTEAPGYINSWGNAKLNVAGPASGERTLSLDIISTIPVVAIVANQGSEIVGTVHIEGVGATKQTISDIQANWETQNLHLTHLNVSNVLADGSGGDGASGEEGTSGGDYIYGGVGAEGADGVYETSQATNGADGESVSTSSHGSAGGAGDPGGNRAVKDIYLNGCDIATLYARNSNGGAGGPGGNGQSAAGGAGGRGGDGVYGWYNETTFLGAPGNGGNGGGASVSSNGGHGGAGGNANSTACTTHGQGAHSTVTSYFKTAYGGAGGAGGSKGVGSGGSGGAGGEVYDDDANLYMAGSAGSAGSASSTGSNGSAGAAGSNYVRALNDPNNKITFTNQY